MRCRCSPSPGVDPEKHEEVAFALSPIDEFRAAIGRRAANGNTEEEGEEEEDEEEDDPPIANAPITELEPTG